MGHEVTDVDFAKPAHGWSWPPGAIKWSDGPVHVGSIADRAHAAEIERLRAENIRLRGLVIDLSDAITNSVDADVVSAAKNEVC